VTATLLVEMTPRKAGQRKHGEHKNTQQHVNNHPAPLGFWDTQRPQAPRKHRLGGPVALLNGGRAKTPQLWPGGHKGKAPVTEELQGEPSTAEGRRGSGPDGAGVASGCASVGVADGN